MPTSGAKRSAEARASAGGPRPQPHAEAAARRPYRVLAMSVGSLLAGLLSLPSLFGSSPDWKIYVATIGWLLAGALGLYETRRQW